MSGQSGHGTGAPLGRGSGPKGRAPSAAAFTGLGIQLVISVLVGLYGGRWLDAKLGTAPWLLIAGAFLGAFAGFYSMYRALMASSRKTDEAGHDGDRGTR